MPLFTQLPRRLPFSETRIQPVVFLSNTAHCNDIEPAILGAWPLRRCFKQAFMFRRCIMSQWHCKLL
jgi:hypothetical protein